MIQLVTIKKNMQLILFQRRDCRGRDRMEVEFPTTCAIKDHPGKIPFKCDFKWLSGFQEEISTIFKKIFLLHYGVIPLWNMVMVFNAIFNNPTIICGGQFSFL
jgi:uncharacterized Rmd1/YagE family protein